MVIQSVVKALNLLLHLDSASQNGLTLGELAELSNQKLPTTHNLLATLEHMDFVARHGDTKRYVLGPTAKQLGLSLTIPQKLSEIATPFIEKLCQEVGETTIFALLMGHKRRTLIALESKQLLRIGAQTGLDDHLYETATGRVMLAQLTPAHLGKTVAAIGLPKKRWPQASSLDDINYECARIKRHGAVVFRPDVKEQVKALAVPVHLDNAFPAAIGIYYPASRYPDDEEVHPFLQAMKGAAEGIQQKWNHLHPVH